MGPVISASKVMTKIRISVLLLQVNSFRKSCCRWQ